MQRGRPMFKNTFIDDEIKQYCENTQTLKLHFFQNLNMNELDPSTFKESFKEKIRMFGNKFPDQQKEFKQLIDSYFNRSPPSDFEEEQYQNEFHFLIFGEFSDRNLITKKLKNSCYSDDENMYISLQDYQLIYLFEVAKMSDTKTFKYFCQIFKEKEEKEIEIRKSEYLHNNYEHLCLDIKDLYNPINQTIDNNDHRKGYKLLFEMMVSSQEYFTKSQKAGLKLYLE